MKSTVLASYFRLLYSVSLRMMKNILDPVVLKLAIRGLFMESISAIKRLQETYLRNSDANQLPPFGQHYIKEEPDASKDR